MAWLQQYANLLSALASTGMMLIWVIYAWLFYRQFNRQRGSMFFLQETGVGDGQSVCMLVNLSQEPVHVLCTLAVRGDTVVLLQDTSSDDQLSATERAKQGPLGSGRAMQLGSFDDICSVLDSAVEEATDEDSQLVEIRVAAIHGFREWPVGARRRFRIDRSSTRVDPDMQTTEQLRSRRHSRQVLQWIDDSRRAPPALSRK